MPIITVPKALRKKLGEDGSDALIDIINHSQSNQKTDVVELVGETFGRLSEEVSGFNQRFDGVEHRMEQLRLEIRQHHIHLNTRPKTNNSDLRTDFKKFERDFIQCLFITSVANVIIITLFIAALLR